MKEYRVAYYHDGKGWTQEEPWLAYRGESLEDAQEELKATNNAHDIEAWIEIREVTVWQRLDSQ